jgi:hypothetical protein
MNSRATRTRPQSGNPRSPEYRLWVTFAQNERVNLKDESAAGAADRVVTFANPPRTARSRCCVKNVRPCRFLGRGSFQSCQPREIPLVMCAIAPGGRLKNLSTRETTQQPAFSGRGAGQGRMAPFRRPGLDSGTAPARPPRPSPKLHPSEAAPFSLSARGSPEGSLTRSRCRMSILRSTSDGPIDERRCRRNRSQSCPRAKRGARGRSARFRTCASRPMNAKKIGARHEGYRRAL